jgi:predicted PurR-regulated permease PerM
MRGVVEPRREDFVPRVISFIVLLAIVQLVGAVFFQVMAQFLVPLFLACVLVVVFEPLHRWILMQLPRWPRLAALLTTVMILLSVLLPLIWLGWRAYSDFHDLLNPPAVAAAAEGDKQQRVRPLGQRRQCMPPAMDSTGAAPADEKKGRSRLSARLKNFVNDLLTRIPAYWKMDDETAAKVVAWATSFAGSFVITGVKSAIGILVGLLIMVISLYYFLADGPAMIRALMRLSPLDSRYEQELLERFGQVSRAVVVATLLSAVVQGALAGIGYYFALPPQAPIFLLTALTMVTAMIPFFGAAAMWILVCIWAYAYVAPMTAVILAVYCTVVVSGIDNVIKPLVLHGQSNLHPLLALLSILGGRHRAGTGRHSRRADGRIVPAGAIEHAPQGIGVIWRFGHWPGETASRGDDGRGADRGGNGRNRGGRNRPLQAAGQLGQTGRWLQVWAVSSQEGQTLTAACSP